MIKNMVNIRTINDIHKQKRRACCNLDNKRIKKRLVIHNPIIKNTKFNKRDNINIVDLPDDILEKILNYVKYDEKQKYYHKCKVWLIQDISLVVDVDYLLWRNEGFRNINDGYGKGIQKEKAKEKYEKVLSDIRCIYAVF
jgi:hypothetical protein